jgi:arginyl-tRNA synthetase
MKCIKDEIAKAIVAQTGLDYDTINNLIEIPPNTDLGDYSFPCFQLSKVYKKSPNIIASEIKENINKPQIIDKIENVNGYVNFFINKFYFSRMILKRIIEQENEYGKANIGMGKTIVIDYCSTNIAKPFHIGHLPTTVIGNSLYKIYEYLGYKCVGINHIGDWGTQFGKLIVAYKLWGDKELIEKDPIKELVKIYVKFHTEAENNEKLNEDARAAFKSIEDGKQEYVELWKWFKTVSLLEFKRILDILKIDFDSWDGESFYIDKMDPVVKELKEKNLIHDSQGAQIVDLSEYNMPPCLILRSDGATLYATRDLAAIFHRKQKYDSHKVLYCVATQQNLHFRQIFKVVELMGYNWANNLIHVANGMISLENGSIGTRKGTVVYLDDVLNEAISKAAQIIEERNPGLEGKHDIARIVGIGAVKFCTLKNKTIKDTVFAWDKVLNFEGETSCYIQYTYARICSVLRKAGDIKTGDIDYMLLSYDESYEVIKLLSKFPKTIVDAANDYEPSILAKYLIDLVQSFNKFYHENSILNCETELRDARIELCKAVRTVIKQGLALLGIESPDRM